MEDRFKPVARVGDTTLSRGTEDGSEDFAVVERPGSVLVAVLRPGRLMPEILLLHQRRKPANSWSLEVVAGKTEPDEPPLDAAKRETAEETGLQGSHWRLISRPDGFAPAPAYSTELARHYAMWGKLTPVPRREADAHIRLQWVPIADAAQMVSTGVIWTSGTRDVINTVKNHWREWPISG